MTSVGFWIMELPLLYRENLSIWLIFVLPEELPLLYRENGVGYATNPLDPELPLLYRENADTTSGCLVSMELPLLCRELGISELYRKERNRMRMTPVVRE